MQTFADAVIVLWGWRRLALALVAGAVSALAFAPFNAFPVLWVTIPVFVWLIDGSEAVADAGSRWRPVVSAGIAGFVFGFGFFLAGLWWIGAAFLVDAGQFAWLLPVAVTALPAILALFWAVGAAAARALWIDGWPRIFVFAVAMAAAEWLRGHLFTGFPWNAFGYALTPFPIMMQSAALIGIWGLTAVAFVVFAAPVALVEPGVRARRSGRMVAAAAAVLLAAHVGYGAFVLTGGPDPVVDGVDIRIVQPSIAQDARWAASAGDEAMARYLDLSPGSDGLEDIDLVVWPESAFPFLLTERPSALAAIAALLPPGTSLVTGAARADRAAADDGAVFNSVYVIDEGGEILGAYDKVHLVPFGEYLPLGGLLEKIGLKQLVALPGGFAAGQKPRTLDVPGLPPMGPLVCYEIVFPGAVLEPGNRPAWLLNVTNDGWYAGTPGPYQHFLQARVRAVEVGLPLVRAANSGISAIVDPHGRVVADLGVGLVGIVDGKLPQALPQTLYGSLGDLMFLAVLLAACSVAAVGKIYLDI